MDDIKDTCEIGMQYKSNRQFVVINSSDQKQLLEKQT